MGLPSVWSFVDILTRSLTRATLFADLPYGELPLTFVLELS